MLKLTGTRKLTTLSILIALATVIHTVEYYIPNPLPIPGAKLGLANVITLITLLILDFKSGLIVSSLRVILASLIVGTLFSFGFIMVFSGESRGCSYTCA